METEGGFVKSESELDSIFTILVEIGGANESMRSSFIHNHIDGCKEWRFMGYLGYGGKYRSKSNTVDCYLEDETPNRLEIIEKLNRRLGVLCSPP